MTRIPPGALARWDQSHAAARDTLTHLINAELAHHHTCDCGRPTLATAATLAAASQPQLLALTAAALTHITALEATVAPLCPTCSKRTYRTQAAGFDAALSESRRLGHGMRVYACPDRRGWHLTSRPDWPTRDPRKDAA